MNAFDYNDTTQQETIAITCIMKITSKEEFSFVNFYLEPSVLNTICILRELLDR